MPNPRLAGRYAKSLIGLAIEKDQLDVVYNDMLLLQSALHGSKELVSLLKSPVIPTDKKDKIMDAITAGKISAMTASFNKLLLRKGRESYLIEIVPAFIAQYKEFKHIYTAKLTTATPVSEEVRQSILDKVRSGKHLENVELNTEVNGELIGGFVLEIGDQLVDASIAFELSNIRKKFQNNDFIYKIR